MNNYNYASDTKPKHFYMVAVLMSFTRGEQVRQRHMNLVLELDTKIVTMSSIDQVKQGATQRLHQEALEPIDEIKDLVFLGFSYLGVMKPKVFYDLEQTETTH